MAKHGIRKRSAKLPSAQITTPQYLSWESETRVTDRRGGRGDHRAQYLSWQSETRQYNRLGAVDCPHLITPHVDRKHHVRPVHDPVLHLSLPLMGIGNAAGRRKGRVFGHASLPLMGIGNCSYSRRTRVRPASHYPSWGSETKWRFGQLDKDTLLITPHGDRKPDQLIVRIARAVDLITPHGDRKPQDIGRLFLRRELITPHGDRKQAERAAIDALHYASLPLMGIGNSFRGSLSYPLRRTHYPSWGSETL